MPSVSIGLSGLKQIGPVLDVVIMPSVPVMEAMLEENPEYKPEESRCKVLIDTGASNTVLKQGIAGNLGLNPRGVVSISTPSCRGRQCETFDVSISIPQTSTRISLLTVIEAPLEGQGIDGLIGRDLLSMAILIYEGPGNRFLLSF